MLGWIASIGAALAASAGRTIVQVFPSSELRSKCTRHLLGFSGVSVLVGLISVPSRSRNGLFLIGPRMPSGRRCASLHVWPPSFDVRVMPHHVCGLGPTL